MKKKTLLKTGATYLLSFGILISSSVPVVAQEETSTQVEVAQTQEEPLQTQMSEELTEDTIPENSALETSMAEMETSSQIESTSSSAEETASSTVEESEIFSEEQTQESTEEPTESLENELESESDFEFETEDESEEESEEETQEEDFEGTEENFYAKAVLNEETQVYDGWKKDSTVLTTLPAGFSVYVITVVLANDEPKWADIIFEVNGYSMEGYIPFEKLTVNSDIDVMAVDQTLEFPEDYQSALAALKQTHPNWVFRPIYVNDTFSYAVSQQVNTPARALINMYYNECYRSLLSRDYNWQTNAWTQWEPGWAGASEETIRYYMDPRNFLNENDIFMFESLTYESYQTEDAVEAALANEFMSHALVPGANYTYAWLFCWIGQKYNINPIALASRVRQEQGSGKSAMISGTYPGYEGLYNYFNIQATGSTTDQILQNGLKEARTGSTFMMPDGTVSSGAWNTPTKALIGGALKYANRYILQNQNTVYAQKFDYDGQFNGKYWHQYMTNIVAPYSEGNQIRRSYSRSGQLNNSFVFLIPVYEERPTASPKPQERKNLNNCIRSLTVNDQQVITSFDQNQRDFYYYVGSATVYANVKVATAATTSQVSFDNVGNMSHKVEVCNITVTAENGDVAEYRLFIGRGVQIQSGFFDNFDVNSYRNRYPQLSIQYGDDLDAYYEHYLLTGKAAGWDGSKGDFLDGGTIYGGIDYADVFDAEYYLEKYPDLKAAFGENSSAALQHFVKYGMSEGRQASAEFNLQIYKENYKDLRTAFGTNNVQYYLHYIVYGKAEGRKASEEIPSTVYQGVDYSAVYDYEYYRENNEDLARAYGDVSGKFLEHFVKYGMSEGRQASAEFNLGAYKYNYPDLDNAFGTNNESYYRHYMNYGKSEGRDASVYSAMYKGTDYSAVYDYEYYREQYPDLEKAFGDKVDYYLWHFVEYGMSEGRQGTSQFDVSAYRSRYADLRAAFGSNLASYYIHYIRYGKQEGRNGAA